ncbi:MULTISPECIES: aldose 1-epimerase [Rhizobium]|uniref:Aldose 1-epimerase n=1 Tax=Rhizobium hidalgonense TaxID=1538159 RepID=A0AAJ2GX62_9HYPH|nr:MULTISPECIES: aldose 1-epimerase [Rhizobium]ANL25796.1 aldose-1-epimerase protein [Rhizobium sp. N113]MDR9774649.1 aldose 1-epimerase [Rhizobium hidalgonense]MDR9818375.1 aldose 1-epimerase [Rhizobium hidalgonense]
MIEQVSIQSSALRADIVPSRGAGLARFAFNGQDLFQPVPRPGRAPPVDLCSMVLVPWSNRISGGGFTFDGAFYPLFPNRPPDPLPIHGNGFQSEWIVSRAQSDLVELKLASSGPGPFAYEATMTYAVYDYELVMALSVISRSQIPLPYGLGFHPFLRRTAEMLLTAPAKGVWLHNDSNLPEKLLPPNEVPDWDFSRQRQLPHRKINNGFVGWNGCADVVWPEFGLGLAISASPTLSNYIAFSPSADAPFFCFEPVSHAIDAHNLPGGADRHGLIRLAPGESTSISCRYQVRHLSQ